MSTNERFFLLHNTFKSFKSYFSSASALYIFRENIGLWRKHDVVYHNVITNDVVYAPFVTAL